MSTTEKIKDAEDQIGAVQDTLSTVQSGLERAASVSETIESDEEGWNRLIGVALGFVALALFFALRRGGDSDES